MNHLHKYASKKYVLPQKYAIQKYFFISASINPVKLV